MTDAPIIVECMDDGAALVPVHVHGRNGELWREAFAPGGRYRVQLVEERSRASHNHYFAAIGEAWRNLPDHMLDEFPSSEHLRKKALVRAGYADERTFVCASKAEAARMAAFMRPMDEYAIVSVREATVTVWMAKSQSVRAMGKAEFQASKEAVLDVISRLIGVSTDDLRQNTGKAA